MIAVGATRQALTIAVAAVALAAAAACGGSQSAEKTQQPEEISPEATTDSPATSTDDQAVPTALVARPDGAVEVHPEPGAAASHTLEATTGFGSPRALLVTDVQDGWLEVVLPERPNGSKGWIRADGAELHRVNHRIEIDLEARTLSLYEDGELVTTTTVAIGTPENPTPTGSFYVTDKIASEDPNGPYGEFAYGLSGFSEKLTEFGGGDGQIGIHGTNDPGTLGQPVSHGCIRVPNDVAELLNDLLYLGTPVTIS